MLLANSVLVCRTSPAGIDVDQPRNLAKSVTVDGRKAHLVEMPLSR